MSRILLQLHPISTAIYCSQPYVRNYNTGFTFGKMEQDLPQFGTPGSRMLVRSARDLQLMLVINGSKVHSKASIQRVLCFCATQTALSAD